MLLHRLTTKLSFLLVLAVFFTASSRASTITVVPSEAQTQIQAAINNSHAGDTISFQAGTYNIMNLHLVGGRTYLGATNGQTILHGTGGNALFIFYGTA